MRDHKGHRRAFCWSTKAWYHCPRDGEEVTFGMYEPAGGTSGEMTMEWKNLEGRQVPVLNAFDDSWSALSMFGDLLSKMGKVDSQNITQKRFVRMLLSCGFEDITEYKE